MVKNQIIDLSPTILKVVSIISIILIFYNVLIDLIYGDSINAYPIIVSVMLFVFCQCFKETNIKE